MQQEREIDIERPRQVASATTIPVENIDAQATIRAITARDTVRWGPVWAGLIITLMVFLLLELLMYALGVITVGSNPGSAGQNDIWVTAIVGLVAFLAGGWVAEATSTARGTSAGLLHGFLVWGLSTLLIFLLSAVGLGAAFGPIGQMSNQFFQLNQSLSLGLSNLNSTQVASIVRDTATWALVSLLVSALAAMLGGWLGARGGPIGYTARAERGR